MRHLKNTPLISLRLSLVPTAVSVSSNGKRLNRIGMIRSRGAAELTAAGVAELADARDSKSRALHWACGFDPHLQHQPYQLVLTFPESVDSLLRASFWELFGNPLFRRGILLPGQILSESFCSQSEIVH